MAKKAALALITLAILGVLFLIMRGLTPAPQQTARTPADTRPADTQARDGAETGPAPPPDFIEQRDETGRLVRRFEFKEAIPHPDRVEMTALRALLYDKPDTAGRVAVTTLNAGRAVLYRKRGPAETPPEPMVLDRNLEFGNATLTGGVDVLQDGGTADDTADDIRFRTDSLRYRQEAGSPVSLLRTDDPVEGSGHGMSFRGVGLVADVEAESRRLLKVTVARDVEADLSGEAAAVLAAEPRRPAAGPAKPMPPTRIACRGDFTLLVEVRRATFHREVSVRQEDASLLADRLEVTFAPRPEGAGTRLRTPGASPFGPPRKVEATGTAERPLRLADAREGRQFAAEGTQLTLDVPARTGRLSGGPFATVRQGPLAAAPPAQDAARGAPGAPPPSQDTVITARQFRFDRGEGRDLTYAEGEPTLTVVDPGDSPDARPRTVRVTCRGPIEVNGNTLTATLSDEVRARETEEEAVRSTLDADRLEVFFALHEQKDAPRRIERMVARGKVEAVQAGQQITADRLEVALGAVDGRQEAKRLHATGHVVMTETDRPRRRAAADEVIAEVDAKRTTLIGKPATLEEPDRSVASDRIVVDQTTDPPVLIAAGPGPLVMIVRTDREGRPLEKPERHVVTWRDSMRFDPKAKRARFEGAVHGELTQATLDCGRLDLIFRQEAPPPSGAGGSERAEEAPIEIERIEAEGAVRFAGADQVVQGARLTWEVGSKRGVVEGSAAEPARIRQGDQVVSAPSIAVDQGRETLAAVGPGYLRVAPSGEEAPDASEVRWRGRMDFESAARSARFREGVQARFAGRDLHVSRGRSGGVPAALGSEEIQQLDLACAAMDVTFEDEPDTGAARRGSAASVAQAGRTRRTVSELRADGGVEVTALSADVVRHFEGRRATFTKADGVIVIEGDEERLARFWSEGTTETGVAYQDRLVSERIRFYPERGEVITESTRVIEYVPREGLGAAPAPGPKPKPARSRLLWSRGGER